MADAAISIQRLCRNDDVDWVREEILTAKANGRHIIPVLVDGATMAADHGIAEGEFLLAQLLFLGRGCEPDINKAYVLYSRAYDHGIHYASVMKSHIDRLKREGRVQPYSYD